jgi:hypothetical protein
MLNIKHKLKYTTVRAFIVSATTNKKFSWVYVPEKKYKIYRIGDYDFFKGAKKKNRCFYVETAAREIRKLPTWGNIRKELDELKLIKSFKLLKTVDISPAYCIFDKERLIDISIINKFLSKYNIVPLGRYGLWKYDSMEGNILDGYNFVRNRLIK